MSEQHDVLNHDEHTRATLARFEGHLPLLERVVSQVLTGATSSVRDLVYLGAAILLRAATEWTPDSGLPFKEYAEVTVTSELLHHVHYPVPVLRLPHELSPYTARLNAMAQGLAVMQPREALALATYPAMALRHPAMPMYGQPGGDPYAAMGMHAPGPKGLSMGTVVWDLFRKRLPLILGLVLATELGITTFTLHAPKTWVAYSTLNSGIGSKDPLGGGGDWFTQGTIVANITELIKSRTVMENTIATLGLQTTPEDLSDRITVSRMGQAGLLKIEAEGETAEAASEVVNTTIREFMRYYATSQSHEARSNKAFFESQVTTAKERLSKAENRLKGFKGANVPEMQADVPQRVSELMAQRDEAARSLSAAQAGLSTVLYELNAIKRDPLLSQRIINNGAVMTATEKLRDLEMNLMDARDIYGADSPVVKNLQNRIARSKSQLRTTTVEATEQNPALADASAKVVQLRMDIAMNSARLSGLNSAIARLRPQAREASTNQVTYEQLQREVKIAETQYLDLSTKYGQSNLVAQGAANLNISVVDAAIPPKEPLSNKLALKLILGLILSLGLGMFISYLMSLREKPEVEGTEAAKAAPATRLLESA